MKKVFCEDCRNATGKRHFFIFRYPSDLWKCKRNIKNEDYTVGFSSRYVPSRKMSFCTIKNMDGECKDYEERK